jgi:hypothetical protein
MSGLKEWRCTTLCKNGRSYYHFRPTAAEGLKAFSDSRSDQANATTMTSTNTIFLSTGAAVLLTGVFTYLATSQYYETRLSPGVATLNEVNPETSKEVATLEKNKERDPRKRIPMAEWMKLAGKAPTLEQLEQFVEARNRSAESLIAAASFGEAGSAYLEEAMVISQPWPGNGISVKNLNKTLPDAASRRRTRCSLVALAILTTSG